MTLSPDKTSKQQSYQYVTMGRKRQARTSERFPCRSEVSHAVQHDGLSLIPGTYTKAKEKTNPTKLSLDLGHTQSPNPPLPDPLLFFLRVWFGVTSGGGGEEQKRFRKHLSEFLALL